MNGKSTALLAVAAAICLACNNKSASEAQLLNRTGSTVDKVVAEDSTADYSIADTVHEREQVENPGSKSQNSLNPKPIDWDKKIVKNATLNAEVKDYNAFSQQLSEKVKRYGGYVSQEEQSQSDYQIQNSVVIKVPVDQFENAVNDLTKNVSRLNEKHISSEDVTTQLIDGKSRLEAKRQVRLRYLDLLKQAKNMAEILTVQKEINDIQEEIELVNGRINSLSHESALSSINLTYFQVIDPSAKAAGEREASFLDKIKTSFANGWYWIGEVLVGLISIWPLLIVIILGIWFFKRKQMPKMKVNSNAS
jgi:hypothetical protein